MRLVLLLSATVLLYCSRFKSPGRLSTLLLDSLGMSLLAKATKAKAVPRKCFSGLESSSCCTNVQYACNKPSVLMVQQNDSHQPVQWLVISHSKHHLCQLTIG